MDLSGRTADRSQLARGVLAGVLTAAAVRSLRKGNHLTGALAGVGALVLGYTAVTGSDHPTETIEPATAPERGELRCASCGQPIRLGQRRGPNEDDQVVHDACLQA